MTVSLALTIFLLGPTEPADCSEDRVSEAFAAKKWSVVESTAQRCGATHPQFYYFAAQAQEKQGKWAAQCKSLRAFLKAGASGDDRTDAQRMQGECEQKLQDKEARDKAAAAKAAADKAAADKAAADKAAADEAAAPTDEAAPERDPTDKQPSEREADPAAAIGPPDDPLADGRAAGTAEPDKTRQRLWLGLGVGAGVSGLVAATTGLYGYFGVTSRARTANADALAEAEVPADFDPKCIPGCSVADDVEREFPSEDYYRQLGAGLTREAVGAGLGSASLGLVLGTLPDLANSPRGRHIGLGAMIVSGAAMLAGGAAMLAHFNGEVRHSLAGYDANTNPEGWRASGYDTPRRGYLLSSALAGLGVGLIVSGSVTAAVRWRRTSANDRAASLRLTPAFNGLAFSGRF